MTKIILQVDGGGIRGITPAIVLNKLEAKLRETKGNDFFLCDIITLCCGTSTGAIISGLIAARVSTSDIEKFYLEDGIRLFNNRNYLPPIPKYDRNEFLKILDKILNFNSKYNENITLGALPISNSLMVTAYNLCSHRTHFIKSDSPDDHSIRLRDAIKWSALSAAYYFGAVDAPNHKWLRYSNSCNSVPKEVIGAVFQDGGQGTQNCSLDYVLTEIIRKGWCHNDEDIIIISLGTGGRTKYSAYEETERASSISEIKRYLKGQARDESTTLQVEASKYVSKYNNNIKLFRLDYESDKDYALDDANAMAVSVYKYGADEIVKSDRFQQLVKLL